MRTYTPMQKQRQELNPAKKELKLVSLGFHQNESRQGPLVFARSNPSQNIKARFLGQNSKNKQNGHHKLIPNKEGADTNSNSMEIFENNRENSEALKIESFIKSSNAATLLGQNNLLNSDDSIYQRTYAKEKILILPIEHANIKDKLRREQFLKPLDGEMMELRNNTDQGNNLQEERVTMSPLTLKRAEYYGNDSPKSHQYKIKTMEATFDDIRIRNSGNYSKNEITPTKKQKEVNHNFTIPPFSTPSKQAKRPHSSLYSEKLRQSLKTKQMYQQIQEQMIQKKNLNKDLDQQGDQIDSSELPFPKIDLNNFPVEKRNSLNDKPIDSIIKECQQSNYDYNTLKIDLLDQTKQDQLWIKDV